MGYIYRVHTAFVSEDQLFNIYTTSIIYSATEYIRVRQILGADRRSS